MSFLVSTADQALVLAFHYLAAAVVAGVVWRSSRRISRPVGRSLFRALGAIPVLREWFANAFTHWFWAVNKAAELEVSVTNPGGTYFGVTLYTLEGVVQGLLTIAFISGGLKLFRCD
jgi:hypothetical protein